MSFPSVSEVLAELRVVALPMKATFRGVSVRETALVRGPRGWAEFAPFTEYDDAEAVEWLRATLDQGWGPSTARADRVRTVIPVNATLPAVPVDHVPGILDLFGPCRTVKIKVAERGQTLADDVARVAATRKYLGAEGRIRIDANGAWNVDEAEHALRAMERFDLEYVEQPCASVPELAELRGRIHRMGILIAADESVRKAADPLAVARSGAADILVIKCAPLGGVTAALDIIEQTGLPVVVSSALESSVGLAAGLDLAARIPQLEFDCGLATASLLAGDVTREPLVAVNGTIELRDVTVDDELCARFAAAPDRRDWWVDRIGRVHALLTSAYRPE
ncbi:MAG: hypothetical protein RL431_325 [Actinomycetota bacterium]|jgi:O-succinylbenzoate synthase